MKTTDKKVEFFLCNKRKIAVKPKCTKFSCLKSIIRKILKSVIINIDFESCKLLHSRRHRLVGQTTKQPLSNFEAQKTLKYKQLSGLRLDPSCLLKK